MSSHRGRCASTQIDPTAAWHLVLREHVDSTAARRDPAHSEGDHTGHREPHTAGLWEHIDNHVYSERLLFLLAFKYKMGQMQSSST